MTTKLFELFVLILALAWGCYRFYIGTANPLICAMIICCAICIVLVVKDMASGRK